MQRNDESSRESESSATVDYRIDIIESMIEKARDIPTERKDELLAMMDRLKSELTTLAKTHHEEAASITRFAEASAHEVSRSRKNPKLTDTALSGLRESILGLEDSHPMLVGAINRFATALSNMGL